MKKIVTICFFILLCMSLVVSQQVEKKIWNDGTIDYLPLGAKLRLEDRGLDKTTGTLYYTENFSEPFEYENPISLKEEGQIWFSYATQDVFGKVSPIKNYTAIVDGSAPELKYLIEGPNYFSEDEIFYFTSDTGFLAYGEDNYSGTEHVYARLNDAGFEDIVDSDFIALTDAEDGQYFIEGFLVDYVGNKSDMLSGYAYLDNTAPRIELEINPEAIAAGGKLFIDPKAYVSITAYDNLSGVKDIFVSLNNSAFARYEESSQIPITGNHSLKVFAIDNLGNKSDIKEYEFSNNLVLPEANVEIDIE